MEQIDVLAAMLDQIEPETRRQIAYHVIRLSREARRDTHPDVRAVRNGTGWDFESCQMKGVDVSPRSFGNALLRCLNGRPV